jgi:hypothetical protein
VACFSRIAWIAQIWLLLLALPAAAQIRVGDFSTSLSGTISPGYTADYGNMTGSDHSWVIGGVANLSGSFYNPKFLSYNASVYLNQSRANSDFQSISDASGVNATVNIFSGSRFPGTVTYSKALNTEGNYAVPGLANFVTHGGSDSFGVSWSENLPDKPSLSAAFQLGNSNYTVYGANEGGQSTFHSLNLHSGYRIAGFNMGAYYTDGGSHSLIPQIITGGPTTETISDTSGYGFNVAHKLPWQGSVSAGVNRSGWNSDYLGNSTTGNIDIFNSVASMHPTEKLSLSASATYSDNLSGQLIESVIATGASAPAFDTSQSSNSLDLVGVVGYSILANLQTSAYAERRTQEFLGQNYGVTSYGGSGSYSHELLNGNLNAALTVTGNTSDQTGEETVGFSTTENYANEIGGWKFSGAFSYSQNVQTLLVTYMNSFYNYSGNIRHRWGKLNFGAGASASRTALTQQAGTANTGQGYNASFGYGAVITATGSYSKASGQALETGAGLVPIPLPSPALPSNLFSLYGGDSYAFALSSNPVKNLILTASYSKANSNTSSNGVSSLNENDQYNALIQYQVRKLSFNSGYARLGQGFSASGTQPEIISSFFIGVSRWFNFF